MPLPGNIALARAALVGRVKDSQVVFVQMRRAFNFAVQDHAVIALAHDVLDNGVAFFPRVTAGQKPLFHVRVDQFHKAAAR